MKKIEVVFLKEKLANVEEALKEQGYPAAIVYDVGNQANREEADAMPHLKLEVVVMNDHVYRVANAITETAGTADVAKGRVLISPVDSM